ARGGGPRRVSVFRRPIFRSPVPSLHPSGGGGPPQQTYVRRRRPKSEPPAPLALSRGSRRQNHPRSTLDTPRRQWSQSLLRRNVSQGRFTAREAVDSFLRRRAPDGRHILDVRN